MSDMNEEEIIKFKGYWSYTLFPKSPKVLGQGDDTFGITKWAVADVEKGNPITDSNDCVCIKGEFVEPIKSVKPYIIMAKRKDDDRYGVQYELIYIQEQIDLTTFKAQKAFLSTFLTPNQVEEAYKVFDNPIEVIKSGDKKELTKIHGVGNYIANCIIERYEKVKDYSKVYEELMSYGLTPTFMQKLISVYKSPNLVIKMVKENPYRLSYDMDGVGFKTADNVALKGGLDPKSVERIKAFVVYYLENKAYEEGDSYVTAGELLLGIYDYFGGKEEIMEEYTDEDGNVTGNNISEAMKSLIADEIIIIEDGENKSRRRVCLTKIRKLEEEISKNLLRLINAPNYFDYENWKSNIEKLEEKQGFKFAKEQMDGIELGLKSQVCLISGLAGSGKSSLVSGILAGLNKYSFAQCALSGKAAARLQEVTGQEGSTIHRLLMNNTDMESGTCELPYDIIILDEISLVGGEIFLQLIKAIPSGCKLIMLGDLGQLESIGALNLAADLFESEIIPTVELKEIHRQAAMSGIITTAHSVRHQEQLYEAPRYQGVDTLGELQDMILDMNADRTEIKAKVLRWFVKYYHSDLVNEDIMKIQVIAPVKERGDACVYNLNLEIQSYYNPVNLDNGERLLRMGSKEKPYYIHQKDKVMCVKNNYHVTDEEGYTCQIFNGWTGIVKSMLEDGMMIYFPLAKTTIFLPYKEAHSHLVLGYASTVHKMQGSDYPVIIGALDYTTPPKMLTNSLLYTLMTRAKKLCVVVAETAAFNQSIATNFVSTKRTFLKEFLSDMNKIH